MKLSKMYLQEVRRICIWNLTRAVFCYSCSTFGEIKTLRLPQKLSGTGTHRGFAFVDFLTKQDAKVSSTRYLVNYVRMQYTMALGSVVEPDVFRRGWGWAEIIGGLRTCLTLAYFVFTEVQRTAKGARGSSVVECQYLVLFKLLH